MMRDTDIRLEILGLEGPQFDLLWALAREVASELQQVELVSIHDSDEMLRKGVARPPAVVVDGQVMCTGRVPTRQELRSYLSS
jgi:hypothetical protein